MIKSQHAVYLMVLLVFFAATFVLQILLGTVQLHYTDFVSLFSSTNSSEPWKIQIIQSRVSQALAATIAGAALSVSGLQMQTMFRNPVAGPYVLGVSAGASLGVAVMLLATSAWGFQIIQSGSQFAQWGIIIAAALGASLIFLLNFYISLRLRDVVSLLIIGLMVGGAISALIEIMQSFAARDALRSYVFWTFGSFNNVTLSQCAVMAIPVAIGFSVSMLLSKPLNVLLLGDAYAQTSGANIKQTQIAIIISTSLLAGSVTAFCGPIGFVGLAVPHIARGIFKTSDHFVLNIACAITGSIVCGLCNVIASVPGSEIALPVNAVTALLGAPFVIWIITKTKRG
jgi:iron complex transport system permease protein